MPWFQGHPNQPTRFHKRWDAQLQSKLYYKNIDMYRALIWNKTRPPNPTKHKGCNVNIIQRLRWPLNRCCHVFVFFFLTSYTWWYYIHNKLKGQYSDKLMRNSLNDTFLKNKSNCDSFFHYRWRCVKKTPPDSIFNARARSTQQRYTLF